MISYRPLWVTMQLKGITQYTLIHTYRVSAGQIGRMKKDHYVSTHTIEMFCRIFDCSVGDIIEYVAD